MEVKQINPNEIIALFAAELVERGVKAAMKAINAARAAKVAKSNGDDVIPEPAAELSVVYQTAQEYFADWVKDWTGKYMCENVRVNQTGMKFTTSFLEALFSGKNDQLKMCFYEMRYNPIPRTILLTFTAEALELLGEGAEMLKFDPSKTTINNKPKKHFKINGWTLGTFEIDEETKFVKEPALLKRELDLIIKTGIPAFEKEMRKIIASL